MIFNDFNRKFGKLIGKMHSSLRYGFDFRLALHTLSVGLSLACKLPRRLSIRSVRPRRNAEGRRREEHLNNSQKRQFNENYDKLPGKEEKFRAALQVYKYPHKFPAIKVTTDFFWD